MVWHTQLKISTNSSRSLHSYLLSYWQRPGISWVWNTLGLVLRQPRYPQCSSSPSPVRGLESGCWSSSVLVVSNSSVVVASSAVTRNRVALWLKSHTSRPINHIDMNQGIKDSSNWWGHFSSVLTNGRSQSQNCAKCQGDLTWGALIVLMNGGTFSKWS